MDKLLIIGGTNFIGRNLIIELIRQNQYDLTIFNRGITNPDIFPNIRKIKGDRNTDDIRKIRDEDWDYIVDLSCYYPNSLQNILAGITDKLKRYIFISTCSVYDNEENKSILRNESAQILGCDESEKTDTSDQTYGNRKAECERILQQSNVKFTILRPALVFGEYDHTDRLYYWLYQTKKHPEILIPNVGEQIFSLTYVKDLVTMIIKSITANGNSQVYNAISTPKASISKILEHASALLNKKANYVSASSEFLNSEQINQWVDMPLWLDCNHFTYDNAKLISDLAVPLTAWEESIHETISYYEKLEWPEPTYGISEAKRQELIESLKQN